MLRALSVAVEQSERHYQFCCGYVQALQDAKSIDDRLSSFFSRELLESWITVREAWVGKSR